MKILREILFGCLIFVCCLLFSASYSYASNPFIADISVAKSSPELFVSAKLKGGFTPEIEEIIHSGAPATFTYYIKLMRYRSGWTDSTEYSKTIKRTVKYDVLKKEYKLSEEIEEPIPSPDNKKNGEKNLRGQGREGTSESKILNPGTIESSPTLVNEKVTKDLDELKKWLANLESIKIIPLKQTDPGSKYYINIKADLKTIKLWFPFNYILFFVSLWDVTTDWEVSSPFTAD
ncbi:MAG TPA: hypothetical protein DCQ99_00935 [Nitrospinae bacterium]|nr:hypothetical protein [Nitrospinota bacterium]HBA27511.1 hypothetical protein [Nitrospinota bacterium]